MRRGWPISSDCSSDESAIRGVMVIVDSRILPGINRLYPLVVTNFILIYLWGRGGGGIQRQSSNNNKHGLASQTRMTPASKCIISNRLNAKVIMAVAWARIVMYRESERGNAHEYWK
jgi:hypothetical protein